MIDQGTLMKIDAGVARSSFLDKHGFFAKASECLHHVNLEYSDGTMQTLSAAEFDSLSVARQDKIRNAGALASVEGVEPGKSWWDRFCGR